jgi:hypothetical protein
MSNLEDNLLFIDNLKKEIGEIGDEVAVFEKLVDLMVQKNKPVFYFNAQPCQTRKVVSAIIDIAKKNTFFKIFLGDVNCEFYGVNLLDKLREVANCNCAITVVLAEKPINKSFENWRQLAQDSRIKIFFKPKYDETLNHLCITNNAYRIEAPHPRLGAQEVVTQSTPLRPAQFGFFIPEDVKALCTMWKDKVIPNCTSLI